MKLTKDCQIKLEDGSDLPESVKAKLSEDDIIFSTYSLNTEFLPEKWLKILAEDSYNNRLTWRHRDPELGGRPYGREIHSEIVEYENKPTIKEYYRVFGNDNYGKKLQKYIKLKNETGDPVGLSKGFIVNRNEAGEITRVFALEDAITYMPVYKGSLNSEVIEMEDKEKLKEIEKLQAELNDAKLQLEEKESKVSEMESKLEKFETLIETKEEEKKSLEDQIIALSKEVKGFKDELIRKEREPYIERLTKLEEEKGSKTVLEIMKDRPLDDIKARIIELEGKNAIPTVETKTLEEERTEAMKNEVKPVGLQAFKNNPTLAKEIAEMKKLDKELGLEGMW